MGRESYVGKGFWHFHFSRVGMLYCCYLIPSSFVAFVPPSDGKFSFFLSSLFSSSAHARVSIPADLYAMSAMLRSQLVYSIRVLWCIDELSELVEAWKE